MANVTNSDVRDAIGINAADIPNAKLSKMIKRAEVTLALELGKEISSEDCTDAEKEFIMLLASVYARLLLDRRLRCWLKLQRGRPPCRCCFADVADSAGDGTGNTASDGLILNKLS